MTKYLAIVLASSLSFGCASKAKQEPVAAPPVSSMDVSPYQEDEALEGSEAPQPVPKKKVARTKAKKKRASYSK